jgi:hypothetical protein
MWFKFILVGFAMASCLAGEAQAAAPEDLGEPKLAAGQVEKDGQSATENNSFGDLLVVGKNRLTPCPSEQKSSASSFGSISAARTRDVEGASTRQGPFQEGPGGDTGSGSGSKAYNFGSGGCQTTTGVC